MNGYIDYTLNDLNKIIKKLHKEKIEKDKEIERLNNQLDFIKDQNKYIDKLEKMVKERNSIIKEAIGYIEENMKDSQLIFGINDINRLYEKNMSDILEILDKVDGRIMKVGDCADPGPGA